MKIMKLRPAVQLIATRGSFSPATALFVTKSHWPAVIAAVSLVFAVFAIGPFRCLTPRLLSTVEHLLGHHKIGRKVSGGNFPFKYRILSKTDEILIRLIIGI
jgi:hypothetical protein